MNIKQLVRPNILNMKPYSSARDEFKGTASVFLDANENPYDNGLNRYPDPLAWAVKTELSKIKGIAREHIFLGNGSDEVIDVLIRIFCEPRVDNIVTLPPTYGMYQVSADTCDVAVIKINLNENFQPEIDKILRGGNERSKILFICSPNNPSGNAIDSGLILNLVNNFEGIVVIDEAYADFSKQPSCIEWVTTFPNVVVMQTFSKAWGLAGIRLGMAFASREIIDLMNKVKPPYNINQLTQQAALTALRNEEEKKRQVAEILAERDILQVRLAALDVVEKVYPSDANFLLVKVAQADALYNYLLTKEIVVRNRNNVVLCDNCLRITVGMPDENEKIVKALHQAAFQFA
jgi:histidinol-phosphate aminotransferase